jgi:hypothetical protein
MNKLPRVFVKKKT